MSRDEDQFYEAVLARDYRFDGKFFTAVKTTGIYCRPICPARPLRKNVEFFLSAPAAEKAGYRPCLRCRPEAAPLSPAWYGKSATVQRALRKIIDQGYEDQNEESFARSFGMTARHLRRLFVEEMGSTPRQFYQDQRLNLARKMVVETELPVTQIAFASHFQSLRRFNDAFQDRFSRAPRDLRKYLKKKRGDAPYSDGGGESESNEMILSLHYRPPFQWQMMLAYLKRHELEGVEEISDLEYRRYFRTREGPARLRVSHDASQSRLKLAFTGYDQDTLYQMIQKVRRLFDLDADPLLISTRFESSAILKKLDEQSSGVRSPGSWDSFETAIMVILGQLVSLSQARKLMSQVVENYGKSFQMDGKTRFVFPGPEVLANSDLMKISTTGKRRETIRALCEELISGRLSLSPHQSPEEIKKKLLEIPGIGAWTAEYIGMRCLSDPDSYPHTDLILKRIQEFEKSLNLEQVRPWRSYAVYLLWNEYMGKFPKAEKKKRKNKNEKNKN